MKTVHHTPIIISLILVLASAAFTPLQAVGAAETFTMAFLDSPDQEPLLRFGELVYTEAFRRLGLEFAYAVYPSKRCGVMANAGEVDGEPGRTQRYNQEFPDLVRVESPLVNVRMAAFATDPAIKLDGWESLQDTTYHVETLFNTVQAKANIVRFVTPEHYSEVPTIAQALKKLRAGRTDIFIDTEELVLTVLQTAEFKDSGIVKVGLMDDYSLYPFLHKKHAALAPKLSEVLKQMKAEGLFEQYMAQATKEVGANK